MLMVKLMVMAKLKRSRCNKLKKIYNKQKCRIFTNKVIKEGIVIKKSNMILLNNVKQSNLLKKTRKK